MKRSLALILFSICFAAGCASKNNVPESQSESYSTQLTQSEERLYTFSWSYDQNSELKPRGGTSMGAPVVLDESENTAWLSIYEPGISDFERDRRAILAMAGDYRVTFDFIETVPLRSGYVIKNPYHSWATEFVEVIEDKGDFISLQHILVMYIKNDEGEIEGPMIVKHWRQDWKYQDTDVLDYIGNSTWQLKKIPAAKAKGKWSQSVYQVDDSPRYGGIGEWIHDGNYSSWTGANTWRPLPRREYTVRDDYNVLVSENRHIINEHGWIHEQDNIKLVVDESGNPMADNPYLVKELGLNRYEKIVGTDFGPGIEYWENTSEYWKDVRKQWAVILSENSSITLKSELNDKKMYKYLFEYAEDVAEGKYNAEQGSNLAAETINDFMTESDYKSKGPTY